MTALAASQSQGQSVYTTQAEQVDTVASANVTQSENSTLASEQTQTTQSTDATVVNNNQLNAEVTQDHSVDNHQTCTDKCSTATPDTATFSQDQQDHATSSMSKTNTDTSTQITANVNTTSTQTGSLDATGKTTIQQTDTGVIVGNQSQTVQVQSVSGPSQSHQQQTVTAPLDDSYLLPLRSSFPSTEVVGYAVFDTSGHLLSDSYGIFPSIDNNAMKQHHVFLPNTPTEVIVAAVNSFGQIVPNTQSTVLFLRSNNYNGVYLNPQTIQSIYSLQIPEGSMGVMVGYVNPTPTPQFDVLDAGTVNPFAKAAPQRPAVEATLQTQTASVADTSATQSQKTVVKSDAPATASTPITQTTNLTQNADANQAQTVNTADQTALQQTQGATVDTAQITSNQAASSPSATIQATQSESSQGASQAATQLAQTQSVTVSGSILNVTLTQDNTTDASSGVTLSEIIKVNLPAATSTSWNTLVNVTYQGTQKQFALNTDGPVTFNESQAVDPTTDNGVVQSASIDYTVAGTPYDIPLSS